MAHPPIGDAPASPSPAERLLQMSIGAWLNQALYVAAKLGIPDLLADGPRDSTALAEASGADAVALYRLLRALASAGVFALDDAGRFSLAPLGALLRTDAPDSLRGWMLLQGEPYHWETWGDLLHSVQTGQPAFDHRFGTHGYAHFQAHPEVAAVFNDAMTSLSRWGEAAIVSAYDFAALHPTAHRTLPVVVDVGGGHGALLAAILQAHPSLRGMLYDAPAVAEGAHATMAAAGLTGRTMITGGDYFASVPHGGDLYLLKHILHGYDDAHATAILRRCREAMAAGGRVLVIELVVPADNAPSTGQWVDLEMLLMTHGGRERTEAEYRALFAAAGLQLSRIVPTAAPDSLIEGVSAVPAWQPHAEGEGPIQSPLDHGGLAGTAHAARVQRWAPTPERGDAGRSPLDHRG